MVKNNNIYFITSVDDSLQENELNFRDEVISILNDENGWKKYDYNFICINDINSGTNSDIAKIISGGIIPQIEESQYPILKIFLKSARQTNKDCGMSGFSCTRFKDNYSPIDIIINYDNWCGGSKSSLPIPEYRKYVINHEVGHWLGLDHTECPIDQCKAMGLLECPASIMQQMTRGPTHIWPCIEQPNPLGHIFKIDNPRTSEYRFVKEGVQQGGTKRIKEGVQQGGTKRIKEGVQQGGTKRIKEGVQQGGTKRIKEGVQQGGTKRIKEGIQQGGTKRIKEGIQQGGTKRIKGGTQKKQRNEYKYLIILIIILLIFFIIIYYIYIKNLKIGHITIFK